MRVLFVEDDESVVRCYQRLANTFGLDGHVARTVGDARDMWKRLGPSVVVCDGDLPDGRWTELISAARASMSPARVVMVTGAPIPESEVNVLQADDQMFVKPVSVGVLIQAIRGAVTP